MLCVCVCVCVSVHAHTGHAIIKWQVLQENMPCMPLPPRGQTSESPLLVPAHTSSDRSTLPLCSRRACRKRSARRVHVRRAACDQRVNRECRRSLPSSARRGAPSLRGSSLGNQRRHHRRWYPRDMHTRDIRRFAYLFQAQTLPSHPHPSHPTAPCLLRSLGQLHCDSGSGR